MKQENNKLLGVMGGMGPLATQLFYKMIIDKTEAHCDQDHLDMIVLNHASMPDRTKAILSGDTKDLESKLIADAKFLENAGADFISIPCNTSHCFIEIIEKEIDIPIINMVTETVKSIKGKGLHVGILATDGTIKTELYQKECEKWGIIPIIPSIENQKLVMKIIYEGIKDGNPIDLNDFKEIDDELKSRGCDFAILACTELSCFKQDYNIGEFYIDAMEILAEESIIKCNKKIR